MLICDGCGVPVNEEHTRERIERLELSTHFRPIHIQVLLIDAAPPDRLEDYFYRAALDGSVRSAASQRYFDDLAQGIGALVGSGAREEAILGEFQKKGFFLAHAVECPIGPGCEREDMVRRLAPMLVKRVQFSYKPRLIALLSQASRELLGALREAGWSDRLVLEEDGAPFTGPDLGLRLSRSFAGLIPS